MRVTFREVAARRTVRVPCIACEKRLSRVIREFQTINPWNLSSSGTPKSEHEIRAELPAQLDLAAERLRKRALCRACEGLGHRINFDGEHVRPGDDEGWILSLRRKLAAASNQGVRGEGA